jgi:hypothetical protein
MRTNFIFLLVCLGALSVSCSGGGSGESTYVQPTTPSSEMANPGRTSPALTPMQREGRSPEAVNHRYPNIYKNSQVTSTEDGVTIKGIVVGYDSLNDKILIKRENDGPLSGRIDSVAPSSIN